MARICFFARVRTLDVLDRVDFYAQDLRALRELGHEVTIAHRIPELRPADLYYVWWWTWAFAPLLVGRVLRKPVVVVGVLEDRPLESRVAPHRWAMRAVLAGADANVFVSSHEHARAPGRYRVRNPRYVPLGVDTSRFAPGGGRDPNLVFTLGWLETPNALRKCFPEIVRAAIEVCRTRPDVRFVIAGEHGDYHATLRRVVDESGLAGRITFPGVLTLDEKVRQMRRCAVYLQPTRFEGFGLAIAEAMSCGAAVITSPSAEAARLTEGAAAWVDGSRPGEIAAALLRLLDDPGLREELGRRARARIQERFSYERRRREIGAVVDEALAAAPGQRAAAAPDRGAGVAAAG